MMPASLTEEEYEAVKAKAWFGDRWMVTQADIMGALNCGLSKAARIRAQALARLDREHPNGVPKPQTQ